MFEAPYLGIPPTGNWVALRYGEFHRLDGGRIVQSHLIFDLPDLMRQAGVPCWQKGRGVEGLMPGPPRGMACFSPRRTLPNRPARSSWWTG